MDRLGGRKETKLELVEPSREQHRGRGAGRKPADTRRGRLGKDSLPGGHRSCIPGCPSPRPAICCHHKVSGPCTQTPKRAHWQSHPQSTRSSPWPRGQGLPSAGRKSQTGDGRHWWSAGRTEDEGAWCSKLDLYPQVHPSSRVLPAFSLTLENNIFLAFLFHKVLIPSFLCFLF